MSTLSRMTMVLAIALTSNVASAQGAANEGIIVQGRFCLDLPRNFSSTRPPPQGTRVTLAPCSGRPSQRFTKLFGDSNWLLAVGGLRVTAGPTRRNGRWPVVLAERGSAFDLPNGTVRDEHDRCLTRRGTEVFLEACRPNDASQRFEMR